MVPRGTLFQIEIQNCHREIVGQLAVFLIAEHYAKEIFASIDLARVFFCGRALTANVGLLKVLRK